MTPRTQVTAPATERGEETRRRILDLAASSIAEHGYTGTSLNDLVRQSGLTKGAFYFHFPSKEALAFEVYRFKQEQWQAHVMAAAARHERALDKIFAMVDALVDVHMHDPAVRAVERLCTELGSDTEMGQRFAPFLGSWIDVTEQLFAQAKTQGDVAADVDVRALAEVCVGGFIGMQEIANVTSGGADLPRLVDRLVALVLRAVKPVG